MSAEKATFSKRAISPEIAISRGISILLETAILLKKEISREISKFNETTKLAGNQSCQLWKIVLFGRKWELVENVNCHHLFIILLDVL